MQFKIRHLLIGCAVVGIGLAIYNHFSYGPRAFIALGPNVFAVDEPKASAAIQSFFASQGFRSVDAKREVTSDEPSFKYVEFESASDEGVTKSISVISYVNSDVDPNVREYNIKYWWTSKPAYPAQHRKTQQQFKEFRSSNTLNDRLLEFAQQSGCLSASRQNIDSSFELAE